jgi:hypothetical protein
LKHLTNIWGEPIPSKTNPALQKSENENFVVQTIRESNQVRDLGSDEDELGFWVFPNKGFSARLIYSKSSAEEGYLSMEIKNFNNIVEHLKEKKSNSSSTPITNSE